MHSDDLYVSYPDAMEETGLIHTALIKICQLIRSSSPNNGNGAVWKRLTAQAESDRALLCKHLDVKLMHIDMRRLYATTFREMTRTAVQGATQPSEEFREQRRRKRISLGDQTQVLQAKKSSGTALKPGSPRVPTRTKE
jgi:hypothetical protein